MTGPSRGDRSVFKALILNSFLMVPFSIMLFIYMGASSMLLTSCLNDSHCEASYLCDLWAINIFPHVEFAPKSDAPNGDCGVGHSGGKYP